MLGTKRRHGMSNSIGVDIIAANKRSTARKGPMLARLGRTVGARTSLDHRHREQGLANATTDYGGSTVGTDRSRDRRRESCNCDGKKLIHGDRMLEPPDGGAATTVTTC